MLLKEYKSIVKTENGYIIHADAADLMLVCFSEGRRHPYPRFV